MAVADDVARLTRECWRLNTLLGWPQRMGWDPGTRGRLAKAAGVTESQVSAWLAGEAQPTTGQALALLDALPLPAVGAGELNGAAR
jgi:transcriptional regulator with XRE-family HTH domain